MPLICQWCRGWRGYVFLSFFGEVWVFKCKKFPVVHEKHHEQCAGFSHGHKHGAEEGSLSSWTTKLQDLLKGSTFQQGWLSTRCRSEFIILAIKSKSCAALKKKTVGVWLQGPSCQPWRHCKARVVLCILVHPHGLHLVSHVTRQTLAQSQPQLPAGYVMQQVQDWLSDFHHLVQLLSVSLHASHCDWSCFLLIEDVFIHS